MTTVKGLVLKEIDSGESSKSICVLTAEYGIIYIFVELVIYSAGDYKGICVFYGVLC